MDHLSKQLRDLLLDYYFEITDWQETETAKQLLETHKGAAEFYNRLHYSLSALEHLDHEVHANCPDRLTEKRLEKLYLRHPETTNNSKPEKTQVKLFEKLPFIEHKILLRQTTTNKCLKNLSFWIPRRIREAMIGDMMEDCTELRNLGKSEFRVRVHILWHLILFAISLLPSMVVKAFKGKAAS